MNKLMIPLLVLSFLSVTVVGCSEFVQPTHEVTLANTTDDTFVYKAFDTVNAHVNPQPFKVDQDTDNVIRAGEEISLKGEVGELASHERLRVFVWEVEGDSAFISQSLTYTADKLEQKNYTIDIERFSSTCTDGSGNQLPEDGGDLFEYVSNPELSEEQAQFYSSIWNRLYTAEVAVVQLADNIEPLLQERESILLPLPYGESFTVNTESVKRNESGSISWSGKIKNMSDGSVTLVYNKKGITGTVSPSIDPACRPLTYKLEPLGGGLNALYQLNIDTGIYLED